MSEKVIPTPMQDTLEVIYTELGIMLAKRAEAAQRDWPPIGDFAHGIGNLCDAMKCLSSTYIW